MLKNGQKAVVIDDLVSTGISSMQSAKAISDSGGIAVQVNSIFTPTAWNKHN